MVTYTMARTLDGLDSPDAVRGRHLHSMIHTMTDLPSPEWGGVVRLLGQPGDGLEPDPRGFAEPRLGDTALGVIFAREMGSSAQATHSRRVAVWVRAEMDEEDHVAQASVALAKAEAAVIAAREAREAAIIDAGRLGAAAGQVAHEAGVTTVRIHQIWSAAGIRRRGASA